MKLGGLSLFIDIVKINLDYRRGNNFCQNLEKGVLNDPLVARNKIQLYSCVHTILLEREIRNGGMIRLLRRILLCSVCSGWSGRGNVTETGMPSGK